MTEDEEFEALEQRLNYKHKEQAMNREDIIRKMHEAGLKAPARGDFIFIHWDQIAMLLDHERAAEREACAQVCDALNFVDNGTPAGTRASNRHCAAAIRARSKQ